MNDPRERTDADLVAAALGGNERAFSELMRRHKDGLYRFVRTYVGDASEAFDLVQESFISAWTALSRFDRDKPFPVWLRRIALNKCRDWSRRRKVRAFFYEARPLDTPASQAAAGESSGDASVDAAHLVQLERAIAALPASLKEPLLLTAIDGMSHRDAAAVLGLTPKAVEVRVYRAKRAVARELGIPEGG
jgi:RNA polymerase sigma-70 factor (ECF subfamily)